MATTTINPHNPNEMDVSFNYGYLNRKSSTIVKLEEFFTIETEDGPIDLKVDITSDFNTIDKKYHEVFFNVLSAKYLNKVSFGQNPFSECKPIKRKKWYEFWKSKYFT